MPRRSGEIEAVDVPVPEDSRASAEAVFEAGCRRISDEFAQRHRNGDNARRWLQKVCYEFLLKTIDNGFSGLIEARIRERERDQSGAGQNVNPFQRGLLAIFAHKKRMPLDGDERQELGRRLWYAYRHYVPPPFLLAFLGEVWGSAAAQRSTTSSIEPDFEQWVWLRRAEDPAPGLRGKYLPDVEEKVEFQRFIAPIMGEHFERSQRAKFKRALSE